MIVRTRSALLLSLVFAGVTAAPPPHPTKDAAATPTTLKETFKNDFLVGVAVNADIVSGADAAAQALVPEHFNAITAENVMKAEVVNPEPGVYHFAPADAFVAYGEQHGMFIVGHTLVWHNQTPAWFFVDEAGKPNSPAAQIARMRSHIEKVAGRYRGRVDAWDVVNEVIDDDGGYRPTTWVTAVGDGDELVRQAFRIAHEAAPDAELYYNDFNAWRPAKRDGIVRMVKMLQAAGIRIDGIGMQGHWGLNYPRSDYIEAAIDAYSALGVKVMITELDVDVLPLTREGQVIGTGLQHPQFQLEEFEKFLDPYPDGLPEDVSAQLSERYAEIFRIFRGRRAAIARVSLWGVHDGMSWKNDYPIAHRTNYPLLFDRERRPKPALAAVLKVANEKFPTLGRQTVFDPAFRSVVAADARIERVAEGFIWAEGPAWLASDDALLFTDVPGNTLYRWSERDGLSVLLRPSGYAGTDLDTLREAGANGLQIEPTGTVLLADSGTRVVSRLDLATKRSTPIATHYSGKRLNSPNDVVRRSDGVVFFTDPPYGLKGINDSPVKELAFNGVYRIDVDGSVHLLDDALDFPNGIELSPDERTLYVSNSDPAKPVWMAYALDANGAVTSKRVFADASDLVGDDSPGLPDGRAVASDGRLFATGPGGVIVFDPDGRRLGRIETGVKVSNCAFGDDGHTLYMTSQSFVARIRVAAKGLGFPEQ